MQIHVAIVCWDCQIRELDAAVTISTAQWGCQHDMLTVACYSRKPNLVKEKRKEKALFLIGFYCSPTQSSEYP